MADRDIAVGNDEAAGRLRGPLTAPLRGFEADLYGSSDEHEQVDYPDVAVAVARKVAERSDGRELLLCGTGIGMSIAANKIPGVRAAQGADTYSAQRARKSNNAQILALGARILGPEPTRAIADPWLASDFEGETSVSEVAKVHALDQATVGQR